MGDQPTYGFEGFEEYILHGEPDKKQKAANWSIAIGLQAVDGLHTSEYLRQTAIKNIEGEITGEEVKKLIKTYYTSKTVRTDDDNITEEADKVSANISSLLNEPTFAFTYAGLLAVHRRIFNVDNSVFAANSWYFRNALVRANFQNLQKGISYAPEYLEKFFRNLLLGE